jgi:hypothetical protein
LAFNFLHQCPDGRFKTVPRCNRFACKPAAEPSAERTLRLSSRARVVKVVIAIRIQHAVTEDGWRKFDFAIKQKLQPTCRPRVSACLEDIAGRHLGVKAPRSPGKLTANASECVLQEQRYVRVVQIETDRCQLYDVRDGAMHQNVWICARAAEFYVDAAETAVRVRFVLLLLLG